MKEKSPYMDLKPHGSYWIDIAKAILKLHHVKKLSYFNSPIKFQAEAGKGDWQFLGRFPFP